MYELINFISHFDKHLSDFIYTYGWIVYALLFLFVYLKTAFVVLTFLPGDSIVFACGSLAAMGKLNAGILITIFFFATLLGDSQNFSLGFLVKKVNRKRHWLTENQMVNAHTFIRKYRYTSIFLARFVPLMRTTVPFVCGMVKFPFLLFLKYNMLGAAVWVLFWMSAGFVLGNFQWVENHLFFSLTIISTIPLLVPVVLLSWKKYHLKQTHKSKLL
ncbi:VTT domain-containing protein [Cytobacillus horneckiae]|uniref:VTT domain-containing protein n=1 Tax=Cytobacillus horneckiae TaxID=549687 RepID=UPI0020401576|nr:VTT domain-containing protein [Cytobacillus horneckiae]MCM3178848.1 VTT domain-containing protein [Cytobacillus horneckiae]